MFFYILYIRVCIFCYYNIFVLCNENHYSKYIWIKLCTVHMPWMPNVKKNSSYFISTTRQIYVCHLYKFSNIIVSIIIVAVGLMIFGCAMILEDDISSYFFSFLFCDICYYVDIWIVGSLVHCYALEWWNFVVDFWLTKMWFVLHVFTLIEILFCFLLVANFELQASIFLPSFKFKSFCCILFLEIESWKYWVGLYIWAQTPCVHCAP